MNSISDIKHAFYINLLSRPDRKQHLENQLKKKDLSAILAVHYFGQPFNFMRINKLCNKHNLFFQKWIIQDRFKITA